MTPATVADVLRSVFDPELGIDIVSLGLVYAIDIQPATLTVRFAVTSPDCPLAEAIAGAAAARLTGVALDRDVFLEQVDEPQWCPQMLDDDARAALGLR